MFRRPIVSVTVVSTILVIYCILVYFNTSIPLVYFIFSISPILLIWLAYTVIRHGKYQGKELDSDEEWGYQDKSKKELDVF